MKRICLLAISAAICFPAAAQNHERDYAPHVNIVAKKCDKRCSGDKHTIRNAAKIFEKTHVGGFQQSHMPNYIFSSPHNRFMLGIGGFVNMRAAYDMKGVVENTDFITRDIPAEGTYATRQALRFDASTSRLFVKAVAVTRSLGNVVAYIETDFRGYRGDLRLRQAYISFKGMLAGRDITTFCDLNAAPATVDFQGPNAYNITFSTMIRYVLAINKHWSIAAAAEMPSVSATLPSGRFSAIPQRVPDFPVYVQYNWGKRNPSHVRASAVLRDMYYHADATDRNMAQFGWGVQLSGNVRFAKRFDLFFNGIYGKGITPYIQDLSGLGLDLVPRKSGDGSLQALPMFGWFAAMQIDVARRTSVAGGYSWVKVDYGDRYDAAGLYKDATYIFCNLFHNITPFCKVAVEYLHGIKNDTSGHKGTANRVQAMIQYNF